MRNQDETLLLPNPRLITGIYFSLLSVIFTFVFNTLIKYGIGYDQPIPLYQALFLAVCVAAIFGALFGKRILYYKQPYLRWGFIWAYLMTLLALPFYDLGFIYFFTLSHPDSFLHITLTQIFHLYLFTFFYSITLVGIWLALFAGIAAMVLRGPLTRYILRSLNGKS